MKILILGGGISGLSAAWYYRKRYPSAEIVLLEKNERLGGWIQTRRDGGFLFEEGPRTFPYLHSPCLRKLISELGLESEVILSSPSSKKRYIWNDGKLRSVTSLLPRFLFPLIRGRFRESLQGDVSIYDFGKHKYGEIVTETLFDPLVLGIYAGDIRKLSVASCFPDWQKRKGIVPPAGSLFALKGGMRCLIERMQNLLDVELVLNTCVEKLHSDGVFAGGRFWQADRVISALPAKEFGKLSGFWPDYVMNSLWRVFLAYPQFVLPKAGFGYLVPTKEKESVLGMVWDSLIFPQQNLSTETRITVMLRESVTDPLGEALSAARRHLKVEQKPIYATTVWADQAIPQFEVGYGAKLSAWKQHVARWFPKYKFIGNYLQGASVEACVRQAKESVV